MLECGVVVVCLPSLCEALGLILSTMRKSNEMERKCLDRLQRAFFTGKPSAVFRLYHISPKVTIG